MTDCHNKNVLAANNDKNVLAANNDKNVQADLKSA